MLPFCQAATRHPVTIIEVPSNVVRVMASEKKAQPSSAAQANAVYSTGSKVLAGARAYAQDIINSEERPSIEAAKSCGAIVLDGTSARIGASAPKTSMIVKF